MKGAVVEKSDPLISLSNCTEFLGVQTQSLFQDDLAITSISPAIYSAF